MNEIIKKIDVMIVQAKESISKYPKNDRYKTRLRTLEEVKCLINVVINDVTIGYKIRESNESLAEFAHEHEKHPCRFCKCDCTGLESCKYGLRNYLNQPYTSNQSPSGTV